MRKLNKILLLFCFLLVANLLVAKEFNPTNIKYWEWYDFPTENLVGNSNRNLRKLIVQVRFGLPRMNSLKPILLELKAANKLPAFIGDLSDEMRLWISSAENADGVINRVKAWEVLSSDNTYSGIVANIVKVDNHLAKNVHLADELEAAFVAAADKAKWIDDIGYNVLRKADDKIEYINPNGKVIKWPSQHPNNFPNQIENAINGPNANIGSIAEGEAAQAVSNHKPLDGFNSKRNLNGQQAAELDIVTADEIIEVKANITLAKDKFVFTNSNGTPGQIAKVKDSNIDEFVNPRGKPVILHVKEPLPINPNTGSYYPSDQAFIDDLINTHNIQFSNSISDLISKLQ